MNAAAGRAPRPLVDLASWKWFLAGKVAAPVLTLLYHRVAELSADPHGVCVAPERFRSHLDHLRERYPVVRFEDDWSRLREPAVCVTFDDGYADNAGNALPLLEAAGVPATFFVATGTLGTGREFWWDELERLVLGGEGGRPAFELADAEHGGSWPAATRSERESLFWALHGGAMKVGPARREGWLRQLREWSGGGEPRPENRALSEGEVRTLAASPWATVGAHTVSHTPLAAISEAEQRAEIVTSKETLERLAGRTVDVFSYPFGKRVDYDLRSVRLCREAGFRKAAAAFTGLAYRWTDPLQLPRVVVLDWDRAELAARLRRFGF